MDKRLIIKELIDHYSNGKSADFAKKLGIKPQTISSWIARNTFDIELLFAKCEDLNANWLLSGDGPMLRSIGTDPPPNQSEVIKLLREKIDDQQKIIQLLEEKVEVLSRGGAYESNPDIAAAAG